MALSSANCLPEGALTPPYPSDQISIFLSVAVVLQPGTSVSTIWRYDLVGINGCSKPPLTSAVSVLVQMALADAVAEAEAVGVTIADGLWLALAVALVDADALAEAEDVGDPDAEVAAAEALAAGAGLSAATHNWYCGKPERRVCVRVILSTADVGRNQALAPCVSEPEPTNDEVELFQVG